MGNQIVTVKWTLSQANRVRDTLIGRQQELIELQTNLNPESRKELGELTDILARDFDWRPSQ